MGFEPQIRKILAIKLSWIVKLNVWSHLAERSTVRFWPREDSLKDFIHANIVFDISANVRVTQTVPVSVLVK